MIQKMDSSSYLTVIGCLLWYFVPNEAYENLFARKGQHFQTTLDKSTFFKNVRNIEFTVSLVESPDLPVWLKFVQTNGLSDGILYGTPDEEAHTIGLWAVGWNKETYETFRKEFMVSVVEKLPNITQEIEVKLDDDKDNILRYGPTFLDVVSNVWPGAQHIISVRQSTLSGVASEKSVFVSVAGTSLYPQEFESLKASCKDTANATKTENDIKKHFEGFDYKVDWCAFRDLLRPKGLPSANYDFPPNLQYFDTNPVTTKWDDSTADLTLDIVYVFIAAFLGLLLIIFLTFIMFFNREGLYERNKITPKEQLIHHKTLKRTAAQIRNMSENEDERNGFPYGKLDEDIANGTPSPPSKKNRKDGDERQDSKL